MPRSMAVFATCAPMAPRPMTPSFLPMTSRPANAFLAFSTVLAMFSSSAFWRHQSMPPTMSRLPSISAHTTSSFTAFAFAPGVLNTTMPSSAQRSSGMLFTPAPARAMAHKVSENCMSCMAALRTRMPDAWLASSVSSYASVSKSVPNFEMLFKQWMYCMATLLLAGCVGGMQRAMRASPKLRVSPILPAKTSAVNENPEEEPALSAERATSLPPERPSFAHISKRRWQWGWCLWSDRQGTAARREEPKALPRLPGCSTRTGRT